MVQKPLNMCSTCKDSLLDVKGCKKKGQNNIFCHQTCQSWLHRRCAGLSPTASEATCKLSSSEEFYCPSCHLLNMNEAGADREGEGAHHRGSINNLGGQQQNA